MNQVLARALRPTKLSQLIGQGTLVKSIRSRMASRPPQTWMFVGPPGTGKTTLMYILAVSFQCQHQGDLWGEPCADCWKTRKSLYTEINGSLISGVKEIGPIVQASQLRPMGTPYRVIIVDECHRISSEAQSMLLKPTEDPPSTTIWLFGTSEPMKLSAAIKRRPAIYQLKCLNFGDTEKFLQTTAERCGIKRPLMPLFEQIHMAGITSPGTLLNSLEKYANGETPVEAVGGIENGANSLAICKAITSGNWSELRGLLKDMEGDEVRWVRTSVAGYLRGILIRENNSLRQKMAATSLLELCNMPFDQEMASQWLWGTLHKICGRYREGK